MKNYSAFIDESENIAITGRSRKAGHEQETHTRQTFDDRGLHRNYVHYISKDNQNVLINQKL